MDANVGGVDKVVRIVAGIALLSMLVWAEGTMRWVGLIGIVPLATGLMNWCPLYTIFGISSCPMDGKKPG